MQKLHQVPLFRHNQITREEHHGEAVDYTYDLLGQLTGADHTLLPDESYAYDANGNRTESHLHGAGYVTGPNNQLLSDGVFNYAYDAEGNQIRKTEIATGNFTEYEYDYRNRLVRVTEKSSGGIILSENSYVYDVEGRRIAQTVDADGAGPGAAETTYYTYDGDNTWADFDAAGRVIARYLYGTGIDEILTRWQSGSGTAWYLTDRLGTVRDLVNAAGALINHIDYSSYGQVLGQTNAATGDRFLFTARELDVATQQYYYRARYYDAGIGRFTQQDPIAFRGNDENLYRYASNAVSNATDPTGKATIAEYATNLLRGIKTRNIRLIGECVTLILVEVVALLTPSQDLGNAISSGFTFALNYFGIRCPGPPKPPPFPRLPPLPTQRQLPAPPPVLMLPPP